jgi:hypothetical protein
MSGGRRNRSFGLNSFEQSDFARSDAIAGIQLETDGQVGVRHGQKAHSACNANENAGRICVHDPVREIT